uniref:Uncharacterized protein n=1 Tax=Brassica oleracea var. oleracea TaxID=109376 RepID=A0A0D3BUW1_BRAOL
MESKEQELQSPLSMCERFYDLLVKLLATQAFKKVTLGYPLILGAIERPEKNSDIRSNIICGVENIMEKNEMLSVTARSPGVRPGFSKGRYGHVSTHLANPTPAHREKWKWRGKGKGNPSFCQMGRRETHILWEILRSRNRAVTLSLNGEQLELRQPKEKAPKKIVSIKEEVDEIRISSRRIKKKTSKGSFESFQHEVMSLKPLKSILRKDSEGKNNI